MEYNVVFQEEKAGGYSVWAPELPGCASQGETFEDLKNIREAIELYLEETKKEAVTFSLQKQFVIPTNLCLNSPVIPR